MKKIFFALADNNAQIPKKENPSDAGFDIFSNEDVLIPPLERKLIDTGVIILLKKSRIYNKDSGLYVADVRPRSGNSLKMGLMIVNSPGTIDETYTGNIKVIVFNSNKDKDIHITKGFKIAQLVIHNIPNLSIGVVDKNQEDFSQYERGEKGFGSSDKNKI